MHMKKTTTLFIIVMIITLLHAGCGTGEPTDTESVQISLQTEFQETTEAVSEEEATEEEANQINAYKYAELERVLMRIKDATN